MTMTMTTKMTTVPTALEAEMAKGLVGATLHSRSFSPLAALTICCLRP
jgi:hypothetical protein